MKWILYLGAALMAVGSLFALIGAFLPRGHVATRHAIFRQKPSDLYTAARKVVGSPAYAIDEDRPPDRLVSRIADKNLPYGGTWTFVFTATPDGGTDLRITEDGFVSNVVFRALARFVFGYSSTIDSTFRDLAKQSGEKVLPLP